MNHWWLMGCLFFACATAPVRNTEPRITGEYKAVYPPEAKAKRIGGTVVLRLSLDEQGALTDVVVLEGPGAGLNEVAAEAVRRFRFLPALKDGVAVPASIVYRYTFVPD